MIEGVTYGDFENGSARKYFIGKSDHVFAPIDQILIDCAVDWMVSALKPTGPASPTPTVFGIEVMSLCFLLL